MHVDNRKQAFTSPETVFPYPRAVVESTGLTEDEKIAVLRNWKHALIRLQRAAGRDMTRRHGPACVDPRLQDVQEAITEMSRDRSD